MVEVDRKQAALIFHNHLHGLCNDGIVDFECGRCRG